MIGNKCKENENGITLLGLILTIIILLILAGISIAMLTGENGIINKAKEHEIEAQLAIIEEAANIIYVEKNTLGIKNVELSDIVRQLQEDGYEIKVVFGDGVKEIVLEGLDIITIKKEYVIAVRPDEGDVEVSYYAVVKDKYFEIKNKDNGVEVVRTESDLSKLDDPNILSASTPNAGYININRIDQEEKKVIISGQNPPGLEILTVTYGKKSAEKQIKVLSKLNYLNEVVLKDYTEIPEDIKEKLAQEDYVVEDKTLTTIEDILLTSPEYMPIDYTSQITAEIKSSSETNFYAVIDEVGNDGIVEYYKIIVKDGHVQAEMTPTNVNIETQILEAKAQKGLITVGDIDGTTNPITIPITSLNNTGTETITVEYGSVSKNCNIEVLSKLDYLDKLLENEDDISDDIIENVKDDGYIIEKIADTKINDITLKYPGGMTTNYTETITVSCDETITNYYYAKIDGKYYKILMNGSDIIVEKTPSTISGSTHTLTAQSSNTGCINIGTINGRNIPITSGSSTGSSTITVSYGGITKTCTIYVRLMPTKDSVPDGSTTFSTSYGTIDVIWIDTENKVISEPNAPDLFSNSLTPVTWTNSSGTWGVDTTAKTTWYDYKSNGTDRSNNTSSMWANAKNSDGSYFVWIPRYAYRITYYEEKSSTNPTGYYDGWGQWRASDAKVKVAIDEGIEIVEHYGYKYIVHPAFMKDTNKKDKTGKALSDYDRGGWDSDITGFWTAKFEMSREGATSSSNGGSGLTGFNFKSVPTVRAATGGSLGDKYTVSMQYDSSKNSHLMKNSEWGAIAYLTHSQYGRNGNEIYVNNNKNFVTGIGGSSATASASTSTSNKYNTSTGVKSSTTGNAYGVYDMSGGSNDNLAAWDTYGSSDELAKGSSFASYGGVSTKYATAYKNGGEDGGNAVLFRCGKIGDATKEISVDGTSAITSTTSNHLNWFSDYNEMVYGKYPFMARGGMYQGSGTLLSYTKNAGVFAVFNQAGSAAQSGFRVTLCP